MTALSALARMLGVPQRLAEDAMHSERAARVALSRRSLFAAAGAMAAGAAFSFGVPERSVYSGLQVWFNGRRVPIVRYEQSIWPHMNLSNIAFNTESAPQDSDSNLYYYHAATLRLGTLRVEHDGVAYESTGRIHRLETAKTFTRVYEGVGFQGTALRMRS